jgi:serine protease inhibitor
MQELQALAGKAKVAAEAQNKFGLRLLSRIAAERPHENVFISPTSIYLALAMAETGSAGRTRTDMRRALDVPAGVSEDAMHESAAALSKALRSREAVELSIANALWADVSMPLAAAYIQRCREWYDAEAITLEFRKPDAAEIINAWVSRNTKAKIKEIVDSKSVAASKAILTNAVYFKGKWRDQFSKDQTHDGAFHLAAGSEKQIPLMHRAGLRGAYRNGDGFEAAVLPYGTSDMALYAMLPAEGTSPEAALAKVSLDKLMHDSTPYELDLKLPRFSLDFSHRLKSSLAQTGMGIAFQYPGADFAPLGSPEFFIGEVLHKTRLEIDEEGTVAAAVTAILMPTGAARPQKVEVKRLIFDRPFALLLADTTTGAVLFAGVVYEP